MAIITSRVAVSNIGCFIITKHFLDTSLRGGMREGGMEERDGDGVCGWNTLGVLEGSVLG